MNHWSESMKEQLFQRKDRFSVRSVAAIAVSVADWHTWDDISPGEIVYEVKLSDGYHHSLRIKSGERVPVVGDVVIEQLHELPRVAGCRYSPRFTPIETFREQFEACPTGQNLSPRPVSP